MPNWCNNKVKVFGEAEQLAQVAQIFKDEKSVFNNIIQSPDWKRLPPNQLREKITVGQLSLRHHQQL